MWASGFKLTSSQRTLLRTLPTLRRRVEVLQERRLEERAREAMLCEDVDCAWLQQRYAYVEQASELLGMAQEDCSVDQQQAESAARDAQIQTLSDSMGPLV